MSSPARAPQRTARPTKAGSAATAAVARTAPATAPREADVPALRVVGDPPARTRDRRRSTVGSLGVVLVGCLFIAVFGMVVFQALLAQTQSRLDVLDGQVSTQEDRARQLDRQQANLESPDRIIAEANRLHMVPPKGVVHLQPGSSDDDLARYDPNAPAPKPVTPSTKVAPTTTAVPPTTATSTPTSKATTPTSKATTPTTKATTPTTKATTPTTKATTPTTKPKTATTKATAGR